MYSIPAQLASLKLLEDMFREIKKQNCTQDNILAAVNRLADKLEDIETNRVMQSKANEALVKKNRADIKARASSADNTVVAVANQTTRAHGYYVNWNDTHDFLKTQKWVSAMYYVDECARIELANYGFASYPEPLPEVVHEEKRFPEGSLFLNVSNPRAAAEILYITRKSYSSAELQKRNLNGELVMHFLKAVMDSIETRSSFEEKYGLKWVEPSVPKED